MTKIILIAAMDGDGAIGKDGNLLCYVPGDLKRFKEITSGHKVVMGRKTFDSLPKGPLPDRENIILTRNKSLEIKGATVVNSKQQVLDLCSEDETVFIIGGGEIYEMFIEDAVKLELTLIDKEFEGADTFFPDFNVCGWKVENRDIHKTDDLSWDYITLVKENK